MWMKMATSILWSIKERWRDRGDGLWLGREGDSGIRYMAHRGRTFGRNYERKQYGTAKEIVRQGMEPTQESLWWTGTCAKEVENPLEIGGAWKIWVTLFVKIFDLLGHRFSKKKCGECEARVKKTLQKA